MKKFMSISQVFHQNASLSLAENWAQYCELSDRYLHRNTGGFLHSLSSASKYKD